MCEREPSVHYIYVYMYVQVRRITVSNDSNLQWLMADASDGSQSPLSEFHFTVDVTGTEDICHYEMGFLKEPYCGK